MDSDCVRDFPDKPTASGCSGFLGKVLNSDGKGLRGASLDSSCQNFLGLRSRGLAGLLSSDFWAGTLGSWGASSCGDLLESSPNSGLGSFLGRLGNSDWGGLGRLPGWDPGLLSEQWLDWNPLICHTVPEEMVACREGLQS